MSAMSRSIIPVYPRLEDTNILIEPYSIYVEFTNHDPDKHTLVLLHGYLGSMHDYEPIIDHFEDTYNIIAIDLRGHGESSSPEGIPWGIQDLAADIKQVLEILVPLECKVTIVASSMATAIALELANSYPGLVEKLFLMSGTSKFSVPAWVKLVFGLEKITPLRMTNAIIDMIHNIISRMATEEERDYLEGGLERFKKMGMEVHRRIFEDAFFNWEASVKNITQPVFIMAGEDDTIVKPDGTKELVELIENSSMILLEDQEHHIILYKPKLVISLLTDFMDHPSEILKQKYYSSADLVNGKLSLIMAQFSLQETHDITTH